jgi:RHS repeat-associated protein
VNGTCLTRQQYRFTYDYGNRLLTANHFTHNGTSWTNTNNYSESGIAYDLNGNIKSYTRRGLTTAPSTFGVIDQLTYTYGDAARPDRLTNVSDAGNATKGFKFTSGAAAYTYDLNGNMTQDNHKSLSISYNYLNLPSYVSNTGGSDITLTYTADGEKLSKVSSAGTRNYVAGIEYLGTGLDAIYHGEGRCTPNGATAFYYEYTIKDHLGNARVNFRANGAAVTFLQELHYYPFGMLMEGLGAAQVTNNGYKYNGKELNEDLGLNWSDYGARWYDAALGRWWSVDPLGENYNAWSHYNYGVDNPIRMIDIKGMAADDIVHFDVSGNEISRTVSDTEFKAIIDIQNEDGSTTYFEAPMPGVVEGFEDPQYQQNDYVIAANVALLNYNISNNTDMLPIFSDNHNLGTDLPQQLDVNLVKAIIIEESRGGAEAGPNGTGKTDIMQVNYSGDWSKEKSRVGLSKGEIMTPTKSVNAGVQWLYLKGMSSDKSGNMNWRNGPGGNWQDAVARYNGGGNPKYLAEVNNYATSIKPAKPENYK